MDHSKTLEQIRGWAGMGLRTAASLLPDRKLYSVSKWMLRGAADLVEPTETQRQAPETESPPPVETASTAPVYSPPPTLSATEALAALGAEDPPFVLDVREPQETARGVIPGARLIPMQSVLGAIGELREVGRPIVVYCAHGVRSANIVTHLRDRGVDATSLTGGIEAWRAAGGAVEPPA